MRLFRRPWIWALRFRKRKGYGVHSPFAFAFIQGVVLETAAYYAYAPLSLLHPWWVRWGQLYPMMCRRLLFRLVNYAEPKTVRLLTEDPLAKHYIRAAVPKATELHTPAKEKGPEADFVFVEKARLNEAQAIARMMPERGMLVCEGIHKDADSRKMWRAIQADEHTGVTFDLYTYGVAFFDRSLTKQHYKVNF